MFASGRIVQRDPAEAMHWLREAADAGHVEAMCRVGFFYENALGVKQDEAEAKRWYRKAADKGHAKAKAKLK